MMTNDDLYIMRYSFRLDCVKIGRSRNPEKRRRGLEGGHIFRIEIVDVFPGKGYLERRVHERLELRRNREGAGAEWFDVDAATAIDAVRAEISAHPEAFVEHTAEREPPEAHTPHQGFQEPLLAEPPELSKQYASQLRDELREGSNKNGRPLTQEQVCSHLAPAARSGAASPLSGH